MRVTVRFLASYRDLVGEDEIALEMPDGADIGLTLDELYQRFPRLGQQKDEVIVSVNRKKVAERHLLHEGDVAVLIPPAVGG